MYSEGFGYKFGVEEMKLLPNLKIEQNIGVFIIFLYLVPRESG